MKKIELSTKHWQRLRAMMNILYPKQHIVEVYGDGMLTLECTHCKKKLHIHWYELLLDHIVTSIAKKLEPKIWEIYYLEILRAVINKRIPKSKDEQVIHPLDNIYFNYFLPKINEITNKEINKQYLWENL